jgi:hypothetical protein
MRNHDVGVKAVFLRLSVALACMLWRAAPASAAVANEYTSKLLTRGFTRAEIQAFDIVQIAPHFALYREWQRCIEQGSAVALANEKRAAETAAIVFPLCSDAEGDLQASLAREIGLPRAKRMIALGRATQLSANDADYARRHTPSPTAPGVTHIGRWTVLRLIVGACLAETKVSGLLGEHAALLVKTPTKKWLAFAASGDDALRAIMDGVGTSAAKDVVIIGGPSSPAAQKITFSVLKDATKRSIEFRTDLTESLLAKAADARSIELREEDFTKVLRFNTEELGAAWRAVEACAQQQ